MVQTQAKRVHVDTLMRVVWRLSNQMPVRHYIYSRGQDATHLAFDIWQHKSESQPDRLIRELSDMGFVFLCTTSQGEWRVRRFEAEREWDKPRDETGQ